MSKSSRMIEGRQAREARWRELVDRQAASGRSVAGFCRDESIAVPTFYWWKARLGKQTARAHGRSAAGVPSFLDLGALTNTGACGAPKRGGIEIRLDLPEGITLTIASR